MTTEDLMKALGLTPGEYLAQELEKAISPITTRVDSVEKDVKSLVIAVQRVETLLIQLQPLVKLINKIPFLK
jgi:hypothetical protein